MAQAVQVFGALVPVAPRGNEAESASACRARPWARADFIAHLIATAGEAPQTRARRRVAPSEAVAAYRALGQWPTPRPGILSRSF